MAQYRRIARGEVERVSFEAIVNIGKAIHLTPDQVAAMAEMWTVPEDEAPVDLLDRNPNVIRNKLLDLPADRINTLARIFNALIDVERHHAGPNMRISASVLPKWLRQMQSGNDPQSPEQRPRAQRE